MGSEIVEAMRAEEIERRWVAVREAREGRLRREEEEARDDPMRRAFLLEEERASVALHGAGIVRLRVAAEQIEEVEAWLRDGAFAWVSPTLLLPHLGEIERALSQLKLRLYT